MSPFPRSSNSFYGALGPAHDTHQRSNRDAQEAREQNTKSTIDTFVIPGRTRYPSDNTASSQHPFNVRIAQTLLSHDPTNPQADEIAIQRNRPRDFALNNYAADIDGGGAAGMRLDGKAEDRLEVDPKGRFCSAISATAWSDLSFNMSSNGSMGSSFRDTDEFVEKYNDLARIHGLASLSAIEASAQVMLSKDQQDEDCQKLRRKRTFFRRLKRVPSNTSLQSANIQLLNRKGSIGSFLGRKPKMSLKCASLDDVYRLGGTSLLQLPRPYRVGHLVIPTCLAATASCLVQQGREVTGIFRIPGQASVVNRLYDHYLMQAARANTSTDYVQTTIGSANLPENIAAGPHDVASAFKKFLWDIPGGILGSISLFKALQNIHTRSASGLGTHAHLGEELKARLIALALLSLRSSRRIAVISAVFGLLAYLKQDADDACDLPITPSRMSSTDMMSSKALGVVFAPLLLGDLSEKINFGPETSNEDNSSSQDNSKRTIRSIIRGPKPVKHLERSPEMSAGIHRTNMAAAVVEMLVSHWDGIVRQLRVAESSSKSTMRSSSTVERPGHGLVSSRHASQATSGRDSRISVNRAMSNPTIVSSAVAPILFSQAQNLTGGRNLAQGRSLSVRESKKDVENDPESAADRGPKVPAKSLRSATASQATSRWPSLHPGSAQRTENGQNVSPAWWETRTPVRTQSLTPRKTSPTRDKQQAPLRQYQTPTQAHSPVVNSNMPRSEFHADKVVREREDTTMGPFFGSSSQAPKGIAKIMQLPQDSYIEPTKDATNKTIHEVSGETANEPSTGATNSSAKLCLDGAIESEDMGEFGLGCDDFSEPLFADASAGTIPDVALAIPHVDGYAVEEVAPMGDPGETNNERSGLNTSINNSLTPTGQTSKKHSPSMIPRPVYGSGPSQKPTPRLSSSRPSPARGTLINTTPINRNDIERNSPLVQLDGSSLTSCLDEEPDTAFRVSSQLSMSIPKDSQEKKASARLARTTVPLPFTNEPPVARKINFKQPKPNQMDQENTSQPETRTGPREVNKLPNVGTLYAEIRRLRGTLENRNDEVIKLRQQLEAMKNYRDSSTLSEKLRETDHEMRLWKHRAEWAEASLFGRPMEREVSTGRRPPKPARM